MIYSKYTIYTRKWSNIIGFRNEMYRSVKEIKRSWLFGDKKSWNKGFRNMVLEILSYTLISGNEILRCADKRNRLSSVNLEKIVEIDCQDSKWTHFFSEKIVSQSIHDTDALNENTRKTRYTIFSTRVNSLQRSEPFKNYFEPCSLKWS